MSWRKLDPRRKRDVTVKQGKKRGAKKATKKGVPIPAAQPAADWFSQLKNVKRKRKTANWVPPAMADQITDAVARQPKGGLSLSMEEILHPSSEKIVLVVKAAKGSVTNREEFIKAMSALNFIVVFLEYGVNCPQPPVIERQQR